MYATLIYVRKLLMRLGIQLHRERFHTGPGLGGLTPMRLEVFIDVPHNRLWSKRWCRYGSRAPIAYRNVSAQYLVVGNLQIIRTCIEERDAVLQLLGLTG